MIKKKPRNEILKIVKKAIGKNGITNGEDLSKIAKKLFGKRFIGIYIINKQSHVPTLKNGQIAILNTSEHWYGLFKKDGQVYESDSYGIDEIPRIRDKKPPEYFKQGRGKDLMDCGSRLISNLYVDAL